MTDTVVVIYSGGMDSFTLLHLARSRGLKVHALSFNYGQRHVRELEAARAEHTRSSELARQAAEAADAARRRDVVQAALRPRRRRRQRLHGKRQRRGTDGGRDV